MIWLILIVLLLILVDVPHFVRAPITYFFARYFRPRISLLEASEVYGICLPSDADFMITHMSNSRYLREFDFGRIDLAGRTRLMTEVIRRGGSFPASSINIRYRLPIYMFAAYKVVTTPVWWDEKYIYLDQRIITLSDGIVRTIGMVRLAVPNINVEELAAELFPDAKKPEMTEEFKKWVEANKISSQNMKKTN